ncbi:MAG: type VI secretion system tip protein VgrG, partial [Granulosicoccus sp.]|nr:type VI secretion system tip protein VgrG [Granulosicoccus sp.]
MSGIDQASRAIRLTTSLPDNTLALSRLSGKEELSELFSYSLECVSETPDLDLYEVLGQPVGIELDIEGGGLRYLHGLVSEAAHVGSRGEYALYRLTMTAWPWMLTRTTDCRIFAEKNVPDIIESVLSDNDFDDIDNRLMGTYDNWNFCVQYQESDFAFISRLMEHEGIYYFFEHEQDRHVMVLCDDPAAHKTVAGYEEVPHYPEDLSQNRLTDHLVNWQFQKKVRSGKYVTKDFAFDQPKRDLLVHNTGAAAGQYPAKEIYDFPGGYSYQDSGEMTRSYGDRLARTRMEALAAPHEVATTEGNVRGLNAGNIFSLTNCEREDQNREYLVIWTSLWIQMDSFYSGSGGGAVELQS